MVSRLGRGAPSARPSAQTAPFRAASPRPGLAGPGATPPQAGGGLLECVCPVEAFSIVPRRLAGGCPTLPGRRDVTERRTLAPAPHGKAQSARRGSHRPRLSVRRWAGMRPSARPRARPSPAAGRRSSGQATARACVQRAQEVPGSQADLFRVSLGIWPAREKLRATVTRS